MQFRALSCRLPTHQRAHLALARPTLSCSAYMLGGVSFPDSRTASIFIKSIMRRYRNQQPFHPSDQAIVEELLSYHPNKDEKIGPGIQWISVDAAPHLLPSGGTTRCFHVMRVDGTTTDFRCVHACVWALSAEACSSSLQCKLVDAYSESMVFRMCFAVNQHGLTLAPRTSADARTHMHTHAHTHLQLHRVPGAC